MKSSLLSAKQICDSEPCDSLRLAEVLKTTIVFFFQLGKNNSLALQRAFL